MFLPTPCLCASIMLMTAASAAAPAATIIPVFQARSVHGDSNVGGQPESDQDFEKLQAPGFEPFNEALLTHAQVSQATSIVESVQDSTIDSCRIAASGSVTCTALSASADQIAYSLGNSDCFVIFQIDEAAPFRIIGQIEAEESSQALVVLHDASVAFVNVQAEGQTIDIAHQGTLEPGEFTLLYSAVGTASTFGVGEDTDSATFNLQFLICFIPEDLNGDGNVDIVDLLALLGAWGACKSPSSCLADLDHSGAVGISDLLALLSAWTS